MQSLQVPLTSWYFWGSMQPSQIIADVRRTQLVGDYGTAIADPLLPEGQRTSHAPVYELKLGVDQRHFKAVEGEAHTPVLDYAGIGASVA